MKWYMRKSWSEPGHSYEWVTLLLEATDLGMTTTNLDPKRLLTSAEQSGLSREGLVYSSLPAKENNSIFRIWPQLERLRALGNNLKHR